MEIQIHQSLHAVPREDWKPLEDVKFPFSSYEFLNALETGKCLGPRTGWFPLYLTARQDSRLLGTLILFLKNNSFGEYIFDFNWAHAYESNGLEYYPKLISAIPFTPATGAKLLVDTSLSPDQQIEVKSLLVRRCETLQKDLEASSQHFLFVNEDESSWMEHQGFFIRHSFQYHWKNDSYKSFDHFLSSLRSKRRREILRERSQVQEQEVELQTFTGDQLNATHAEIMFSFYESTIEKMDSHHYLTASFFQKVFETMKDKILFVLATKQGTPVAGALNFLGEDTLFGRYWGCLAEFKSLHFEVCYYQGIEYCISKGLRLFEAGAQGEHKFQRGFMPEITRSAHRLSHPQLRRAVEDFVEHEKLQIETLFAHYEEHSPFRKG